MCIRDRNTAVAMVCMGDGQVSERIQWIAEVGLSRGGVVVRRYEASDLDALWMLDQACFSADFRFDRQAMRRFAERRGAISLVAEGQIVAGQREIAGFVIVHLEGK